MFYVENTRTVRFVKQRIAREEQGSSIMQVKNWYGRARHLMTKDLLRNQLSNELFWNQFLRIPISKIYN